MTRDELRAFFCKYLYKPTLRDNTEILEICCKFIVEAIKIQQTTPVSRESDGYAKVILQMIMSKALHLNSLAKGVSLSPGRNNPSNNIVDPTVLAVLVRNIFETTGMFNMIYRATSSQEKKELIYKLWQIAGLSYRQRFRAIATAEGNLIKAEQEKKTIERLIADIEDSSLFKRLDPINQDKIRMLIKRKNYLIRFDAESIIFLAWHDLIRIMGIKEKLFSEMYTFFSLYSHPSFVSVLQFGQMFEDQKDSYIQLSTLNLRFAAYFICVFIADYIHVFPQLKETFERLKLEEQIMINGINGLVRGPDFAVNSSLSHLN
jgi:hypothetical protein